MPVCLRVKTFVPIFSAQCSTGWDNGTRVRLRTLVEEGARHLKLDFVTHTEAVGVVEATNVVLLLDNASRDETIEKSYAAQELPIGSSEMMLPRRLADPVQLGRYLNFLYAQTGEYMHAAPAKALKRGLSLARILLLGTHDDAIVELLRNEHGARAAALVARRELVDRLVPADCQDPRRRDELQRLRDTLLASIVVLEAGRVELGSATWHAEVQDRLSSLLSDAKGLIAGDR